MGACCAGSCCAILLFHGTLYAISWLCVSGFAVVILVYTIPAVGMAMAIGKKMLSGWPLWPQKWIVRNGGQPASPRFQLNSRNAVE